MDRSNVSLSFHATFPPSIRYISEILQLASTNFRGTKEEISEITGIPTGEGSGKVVPHIKYANFMGIVDYAHKDSKYSLELTKLGRIIYIEDKYLMEKLTKYLLNYFLCEKEDGAPHWGFIFNNFNYDLDIEYTLTTIEEKAKEYFGKSSKMTVVKSMYTGGYGFDDIKIMSETDNKNLVFNRLYIDYDALYIYAYTLLYSWEKYFSDKVELTIEDIVNTLRWNSKFGFDYTTILNVFDELQNIGVLKINKQLNPITIIKTTTSEDVLSRLYDL